MRPYFTAALSTIVMLWKQPKCPSIDEWIRKWSPNAMDYYLGVKKNELLPFVRTWMDLEAVMLNEVSQTEKDKCHMISLICRI